MVHHLLLGALRKGVLAALIVGLIVKGLAFAGNPGYQVPGPVTLSVGVAGIEPGMAGLWMAKEANFFVKEGLDVEFIFFSSGTDGVQALVAGDVAVMAVGGPSAIRAVLAGAELVCIAELLGTMPYTLFAAPKIAAPADLRGKRLGISKFGGSSDFAARYMLARLGLDAAKDVTILQLGDHGVRLAALRAGSIDATVFFPPETLIARRLGLRELADTSSLGLKYPHEELVVSRSFLREQPDTVRRLLKAVIRGTHYFKTHPEDGIRCLAEYLKTEDAEALAETYRVYAHLIPVKPIPTLEGIQMVLKEIDDPRSRRAKPEEFVDLRLVRELDETGFIDRLSRE